MAKRKVGVLISGRGSNLKALLSATKAKDFPASIVCVISNKANAPGLAYAKEAGVPQVILNHKDHADRETFDRAMHTALLRHKVEIVCLAGFMRLLSPWFVKQWLGKMLNIHPSLLPAFKGLDAQQQALDAGVREAGCTVHFVTEEMDAGPTILQAKVPVFKEDTADTLAERILVQEHIIYPEALKRVAEGKAGIGKVQP